MSEHVEKIPQHRHCKECGKAFVGTGLYCSEKCDEGRTNELRKKKNTLLLIWGAAFLMMVVAIWQMVK